MSEFKDKVDQYKQTIVDEGFKQDDGFNSSPITDEPTISIGDEVNDDVPQAQEHDQNFDQKQQKDKKTSRKTVEGLKKRIDQITFEKNVEAAQKKELLAKVQTQERWIAEQQSLLEQNEQHKNAYYENNLQTREKSIINELKVAKEDGDIDKEIALSKELAKVTADQSTYGYYKSQLRKQNSPDNYNDNIYPQPTYGNDVHSQDYPNNNYEEPINEAYDSWLDRNSWADPESRDYSPRLRDEATVLANDLDEMLRYNGKAQFIGTEDYFKSIDNLMSERYGVKGSERDQEQELEPRQMDRQSYSVAPVSRNGSSMADQYIRKNPNNTRNHTSLTEEEYKIARNLQIKLPNGSYATGDEAVRRYAEAKGMKRTTGSNKIIID